MKVVIVAKTRMGSGSCVGGLTFEGQSLRLIPADKAINDHFNQEYEVGDVWDIDYVPDSSITPPHVENVIVTKKRKLPPINDLSGFIERKMTPCEGGTDVLFEGLAQATQAGVQYIAERTGIPRFSTMIWRPDQPLIRDDDAKRIRYRYPGPDGGRTLTFVGYQEPLAEIPAGALLRVSLAHWWRPEEKPDYELRCHVQLSGWYLPQEAEMWPGEWEMPQATMPVEDERPLNNKEEEAVPDMNAALSTLKRVFGYDTFRPLQAEIIDHILNKRDSLAIMPTGSGKSLCYQLPALLFSGLTVVVSPLISLMQDQVDQLRELGISAAYLNSSLNYNEYVHITNQIKQGRIKLLYAAPETLLRPETLLLLQQTAVDCLTIDEAHCISEWGHDFRPEYRQLVDLRERLPNAVCLAVTATATKRVREDIKASLAINDAGEFIASFDRPNLFLAVEPRTSGLAQTIAFLEGHRDEAGIIYCSTQNQVDELAEQLASRGWPVLPYHAGLDNGVRRLHQRRFTYEEGIIIVATIAFGMGIDKSNVRFVLHYNLPKNLESYYQQIGRAGRDGLRSDCLLLFGYDDVRTIRYFIGGEEPEHRGGSERRLQAMLDFCDSNRCRRQPLLSYFAEAYRSPSCAMCDNCESPKKADEGKAMDEAPEVDGEHLEDLTIPAQKFLSCVQRTGQIFGSEHIINVLRGSRAKSVLSRKHDQLSTYGIGREFSRGEWQLLVHQFIEQGLITKDMKYGGLKLTPKAFCVFKGEQVFGSPPVERAVFKARAAGGAAYDQELFTRLRAKRTELAAANHVPPYVIFSDRSLAAMATHLPQSRAAFASMYGVGETKLEKYAADFLPLIQAYCLDKIDEKGKTVKSPIPDRDSGIKKPQNKSQIDRIVKMGESGNPENVPELIAALSDVDGNVRRLAASALGKLGDKRAVQPLLSLLDIEEKPQVRQYAVKALGKIGVAQAEATLQEIMQDKSEQRYTREAAKNALRQIR